MPSDFGLKRQLLYRYGRVLGNLVLVMCATVLITSTELIKPKELPHRLNQISSDQRLQLEVLKN